jgi:hypothetical protein
MNLPLCHASLVAVVAALVPAFAQAADYSTYRFDGYRTTAPGILPGGCVCNGNCDCHGNCPDGCGQCGTTSSSYPYSSYGRPFYGTSSGASIWQADRFRCGTTTGNASANYGMNCPSGQCGTGNRYRLQPAGMWNSGYSTVPSPAYRPATYQSWQLK